MRRRKRRIIMGVETGGVSFGAGCMVLFLDMCDGISRSIAQKRLMRLPNLVVEEEVGVEVVVDEDAAVPDEEAEAILRILKTVQHHRLRRESAMRASSHLCPVSQQSKKQPHQQMALLQSPSSPYQRWRKLLLLAHLCHPRKGRGQSKLMLVRRYDSIPFCLI
jgi:hypothetical protein